jgi:hypothetical protein
LTHTLPAYAADRYKLVVDQNGKRAEIGIYDKSGSCNLLAGGDCHVTEIPATIERLTRVADSRRDADDPITLAAIIARTAEQLEQVGDDDSAVAETFNGDWASVYMHLKSALLSLSRVADTGAGVAVNMGYDLESEPWLSSADFAESSIRHITTGATLLHSAAAHAAAGQSQTRPGAGA